MANSTIQLKHSGTASNVPASLVYGELAINYADGILYYKNNNNYIVSFTSGGGGNQFTTFNANGTLLVADISSDVFYVNCGSFIEIVGDGVSDSMTISANVKPVYDLANSAYSLADSKVISVSGTGGQIYSSGGKTPTLNLVFSGVANGTYGGNTKVPVIVVDDYGRITSISNTSLYPPVRTLSVNTTLLVTDSLILANSNSQLYLTFTLPASAGIAGKSFQVKNINNGTVTIVGTGGDTLDGYANLTILFQNSMVGMISTGAGYVLF